MSRRLARISATVIVASLLLAILALPTTLPSSAIQAAGPAMTGLHVVGNRIVNGDGQTVRPLGVNRSGMEYACIQGWGIFDGPSDAASIEAMLGWKINTIRIPLNEDCWLGINGVPSAYGGANYRAALANYVSLLNSYGLAVILDLHWAAPGGTPAVGLTPMPNRDHSVTFWQQVADAYKGNSSVIFDLYNEPFPDSNRDTAEAWRCWRDGGTCAGIGYQAAGMQELVTAVRGTGATNLILVGGIGYSGLLSNWLAYRPSDPLNNLAASWHVYNFSWCATQSCWESMIAPVADQVPVVTGEIGEDDCAHGFVDPLMNWLDARGIGYLGWTWNTWNCATLISNYDGTPTNFGRAIRDRFVGLAASPPTPGPTPSTPPVPAPGAATVTDPLDNFSHIADRSPNLGFDVANAAFIGNDPSRLVRSSRTAEWAVWSLQGMTSFTAVTYHYIWEGPIGTFSFAASADGANYTPVAAAIFDRGGDWKRIDYALTLPTGTNFVRMTFPNISVYDWAPQIGEVSYSASAAGAPATGPAVRVTTMLGNSSAIHETQYRVRLHNDDAAAQSNLSLRVYVDLGEIFAAGLGVGDLTTDKFWDQCGTVALGPYAQWRGTIYYVELSWQEHTFAPGTFCEVQFRLRTANWQTVWSAANDHAPQGLDAATYRQTACMPVYHNGTRIYGTEP